MREWDIEWKKKTYKYKDILKICPVCNKEFITRNDKREQITCSHSCANTYFRTGKDHPNYKKDKYRNICFEEHKKECVVCGEDIIVEVHHLDGNHDNDDVTNLIPICPTHHKYWHSRHKYIIEDIILEYAEAFRKEHARVG